MCNCIHVATSTTCRYLFTTTTPESLGMVRVRAIDPVPNLHVAPSPVQVIEDIAGHPTRLAIKDDLVAPVVRRFVVMDPNPPIADLDGLRLASYIEKKVLAVDLSPCAVCRRVARRSSLVPMHRLSCTLPTGSEVPVQPCMLSSLSLQSSPSAIRVTLAPSAISRRLMTLAPMAVSRVAAVARVWNRILLSRNEVLGLKQRLFGLGCGAKEYP